MKNERPWVLAAVSVLVVAALGLAVGPLILRDDSAAEPTPAGTIATASPAVLPEVTVYKSPTCGCCRKWIEHLQAAGFSVKAVDVGNDELTAIKRQHGVGEGLASCHTALVGGYVVEGHVPADAIIRLLQERPEVQGLAVPGMPIGAPGMEVPGREADAYQVLAFDSDGKTHTVSGQ